MSTAKIYVNFLNDVFYNFILLYISITSGNRKSVIHFYKYKYNISIIKIRNKIYYDHCS